ncbi:MAG: DUF262 domain-containing protein [bacterium]|nr:DUF262 domain-containing protein [bacterium]
MKMELRRRALDKLYKRRDRIEMPDFQREEVWTLDQKRLLIDTILRGWHLPKFYFRKVDESSYECVDGQQRLSAVWEFYDNKLLLANDTTKAFGGPTYAKLKPQHSDDFDDFELDIEELEDTSDEDLKELFVRLQLGTPLTTAEKLNAVSGEARDFAHWVADQEFFGRRIGVRDTRYAHFDIASKWLFVEARGVLPQMRFAQLNNFLRENTSFSRVGDTAKRMKAVLQYLTAVKPDQAQFLRNRASVLSVCMLASAVVRAGVPKTTAPKFGAFLKQFFSDLTREVEKGSKATNADLLRYQEAISYGSTGADSIRERLEVLTRNLAAFDPLFAPVIRAQAKAGAPVAGLASEVSDLVYVVNEKAAAVGGVDTFKMTTRSSKALKALGKACQGEGDFGAFVDNLYFLVYEGSGDCKRLPSPPPNFSMDVKFLRTHLRHDLDHGNEADAAKKRKRAGAVFEKYTGKDALGECGPDELLAAQIRLLKGLKEMLENL